MKNSLRKHWIITLIITITGAIVHLFAVLLMRKEPIYDYLMWFSVAAVVIGLIYGLITVRCPYCNHSLLHIDGLPKHCPECCKKIDD